MERNAIVNNSGNQTSPRTPLQESPSTFDRRGARAREYQARPPARFSSLRSDKTVNQKQQPSGNTLLAQRYLLSGNSYFWRTAFDRVPFLHPPGNPILRFGAWDFSGAWILELGAFIFPGIPLGPIP